MVARSEDHPETPEYYTTGLRCASGAATVALGPLMFALDHEWGGKPGEGPIARFANSFERSGAVEACYRVVVWAYLTTWVHFIWSEPDEFEQQTWDDPTHEYDRQMDKFEAIFGIDNPHERAMKEAGRPLAGSPSEHELGVWAADRADACMRGMIAAALGKPDTDFGPLGFSVETYLGPLFLAQWEEGAKVLGERLDELLPAGLPAPGKE